MQQHTFKKPMRVVQLGCGVTGLVCAEFLVHHPQVTSLILADLHPTAAVAMKARVNHPKLEIQQVDARVPQALQTLFEQADLVINALPWHMNLGTTVLTIAAQMGIWYLDFAIVADSIAEFERLSRLCADSGITAVTATGQDPGMSDIFACYAANQLDSVRTIRVIDGDNGQVPGQLLVPAWSPVDFLWETSTPAAIFRHGSIHYLPPLHKRQIYQFPDPLGSLPIYHTLHEETFLLPQFIRGVKYVDFRLSLSDDLVASLRLLRKLGLHRSEPITVGDLQVRPLDVVCALLPRPEELIGKIAGHACLVVEVTGKQQENHKKITVWTLASHQEAYHAHRSNAIGYLVGLGGAVAAEMLIEGDICGPGLFVPEQIEPKSFIKRLQAKGLEVYEKISPAIA
ncbi:saccharopine dehydrogenase family protein [Nostoc sp. C117]|uniref:saccharopine dehydrogenase family protein n=1 Tax=Nostoc sp. C117 TaxID=3349875 RepID=UPI00370DBC76